MAANATPRRHQEADLQQKLLVFLSQACSSIAPKRIVDSAQLGALDIRSLAQCFGNLGLIVNLVQWVGLEHRPTSHKGDKHN